MGGLRKIAQPLPDSLKHPGEGRTLNTCRPLKILSTQTLRTFGISFTQVTRTGTTYARDLLKDKTALLTTISKLTVKPERVGEADHASFSYLLVFFFAAQRLQCLLKYQDFGLYL
ncbi:MAG: hypothetical protein ACTFAL_15935 [Candidatus Electronema sp. V4]|uniref:hypothetical protein n=1 Tax=Candidatus Electronema sp. V4 TaxID=3454756 RepID=UPI0040558537